MNGEFRFADVALLRQLAHWLGEAGLEGIEVEEPGGRLRLRVGAAVSDAVPEATPASPTSASPAPAPPTPASPTAVSSTAVRCSGFGELLWRHPDRREAFAPAGSSVGAGQVVALLRIGAVYTPVTAPVSGTVIGQDAEEGARVGHGTTIMRIAATP